MANSEKDIRQQEEELFASMAKVHQPMAPDSEPTQSGQASSQSSEKLPWDHADSIRMAVKARFPGLSESDLDEAMM